MKNPPLATIILTTYNEPYLEQTMQSLFDQTEPRWECFVFNTNPNRKLHYADPRVTVLDYPNNFYTCVEAGMRMANSNIIMWQSDDDINFPERVKTCVEHINDGADFIFASALYADTQGFVFHYYKSAFDWEFHKKKTIGASMTFGAFRKDKAPALRPEISFLIDYVFVTDCYLKGMKFVCTPTPLGVRICHNKSMSSAGGQREAEKSAEIELIRQIYNDPLILSERNVKIVQLKMPKMTQNGQIEFKPSDAIPDGT